MKRAIVEISASRLELASLEGGRMLGSLVARFPAERDASLASVLAARLTILSGWVNEARCQGAPTIVIHHSPSGWSDVISTASSLGASQAEQARRLAVADRSSLALDSNPWDLRVSAADGGSGGEGAPLQTHAIACAEPDSFTGSIWEWVRASGLKPSRVLPSHAILARHAVRGAIDRSKVGPEVSLVLGDGCAILAGAHAGRLAFVRTVGVGLDALIEAAAGAFKDAPDAHAAAIEYLSRAGIPKGPDPDRPDLYPAIRPVMQRIEVEVRQSIRFAMPPDARQRVSLGVGGLGRGVRGLGASIAESCGAAPRAGEEAEGVASARAGAIAMLLESPLPRDFGTMPLAERDARTTRALQRTLGAGVGVAIAIAAGQSVLTRLELSSERSGVAALRTRANAADQPAAVQARLVSASAGLARAEATIQDRLGNESDWAGVLWLVSSETSEGIRFESIELARADVPTCRLQGVASGADAAAASQRLQDLVAALARSPLVSGANLGSTTRGTDGGQAAQRFELTLKLVGLPGERILASEGEP